MNQFLPRPTSFFCGNNEAFFFTCSTHGGITSFQIPQSRLAEIEGELGAIDELYGPESLDSIKKITARILRLPPERVKLTHSVYYHRLAEWNTEIPIDDSILGNEDIARLDAELDPTHKTFELYQYFKKHRHFAVKVVDRAIVSFCFDNSNGTLSVETVPDFRNQGLSKKCLAKVTKAICDSKSYPKISFPTDIENVAARKVAESVGFQKNGEGLWVRVSLKLEELRAVLPEGDINLVT